MKKYRLADLKFVLGHLSRLHSKLMHGLQATSFAMLAVPHGLSRPPRLVHALPLNALAMEDANPLGTLRASKAPGEAPEREGLSDQNSAVKGSGLLCAPTKGLARGDDAV